MGCIKDIKMMNDSTKPIPADRVNQSINLKTSELF